MTIIIDTGVFYAFVDKKDGHHLDSVALLYHSLGGRFGAAFISDYVILETTLLIRIKLGPNECLSFLDFLRDSKLRIVAVGEENLVASLDIMRKKFPRLSVCDSSTLVLMNSLGINGLLSYDERSFGGLVQNIRGNNYYESLPESERVTIRKNILGWK